MKFIGPNPFERRGVSFEPRVATVFPEADTIVTLAGIHAMQRRAYVDHVLQERAERGEPALSEQEEIGLFMNGVDLVIQPDAVYIRPDPQQIDRAIAADDLLQQAVPKQQVRFLLAGHAQVYEAIKHRGECWRITPRPISKSRIRETIENSRMRIKQGAIYYHSPSTGTRLVTYEKFRALESLSDTDLQNQLLEIQFFSGQVNRYRHLEVDFFIAHRRMREPLQKADFSTMTPAELRRHHAVLVQQFAALVPPELQDDNLENAAWTQRMLEELQPLKEDAVLEEERLGLAPEFYRHILWLPGGGIEDNEFAFDPVFTQPIPEGDEFAQLLDDTARALILNHVRDYPDLEYINVGRVNESLALDRPPRGRRDVYVVQMKRKNRPNTEVKIIRFQKWDVRSHLDEGLPLLQAMTQSEEYTEYILDRRLGCRRLGMNLPEHLFQGRVSERYDGKNSHYPNSRIWRPYFERDYFPGMATDKIPKTRFKDNEFAIRFARLMGQAAASDMIVGRWDEERSKPYFDDGDEVLLIDEAGMPYDLMVTHHTGSFARFTGDLRYVAPHYATPINARLDLVPDRQAFAAAYVEAFVERFRHIKQDLYHHKSAFDALFSIRSADDPGSFRDRWERVLKRLETTDIEMLADELRSHIEVELPEPPDGEQQLCTGAKGEK